MRFETNLEQQIDKDILIRDAAEQLPTKARAVVALRLAGYTQLECSRILGMTRANIGIIHKRAITNMESHIFRSKYNAET